MTEGAVCKLRFSMQYFLVFVRKTSHSTLEMKSKYAKEHSTAYKVGSLEFISEKACFPVQIQFFFLPRQSWKKYGEFNFSEFSKHFPEVLVKCSRSVIESHQVNY